MAAYVDDAIWPWRGQLWCHLLADSLDELHTFAKSIGLKREWFQDHTRYPHYDMNENRRRIAVKKGAIEIDKRTTIEKAKLLKAEFDQLKLLALQEKEISTVTSLVDNNITHNIVKE